MLRKTTNAVGDIQYLGDVCVQTAPPPVVPSPPPTTVPAPPGTSPPAVPPTATATVNYYQDAYGDCYKIITWNFGGALQPYLEKIPIPCSQMPAAGGN